MNIVLIPRPIVFAFALSMSFCLFLLPAAVYASDGLAKARVAPNFDDRPGARESVIRLEGNSLQACQAASAQATSDTNKTIWFLGGCVFGLLGLGAAYVIKPNPPATALVGQDAQYVAEYTDCYTDTASGIQQKQALYGCLVGTGVTVLLYAVIAAAAVSTANL